MNSAAHSDQTANNLTVNLQQGGLEVKRITVFAVHTFGILKKMFIVVIES